jgi:hypothetical protein
MFSPKKLFLFLVLPAIFGVGQIFAQLTGTVIGTPGSYANSQWTVDKAFDGNLSTFLTARTPVETGPGWILGLRR